MSVCNSFKRRLSEKGIVIKKLGSGSTGITFSVCDSKPYCEFEDRKSVKVSRISKHSKKKTQPEIDYEVNLELMKLLKYTPHINSVYSQVKCGFFPSLMENQSDEIYFKYLDWSSTWKLRKGHPITVTTMELGNYDFFDHINYISSVQELKELMFQFVYTLAVIQYYMKGFKHGDLKEDNLLVYLRNDQKPGRINYNILGKTFSIDNKTAHVKLIDFDFAASDAIANCRQPSLTDEETTAEYKKLECNEYSIQDSRYLGLTSNYKPHYDLFFFLNRLTTVHFTNDKFPELNKFLTRMLPREYQTDNLKQGDENIIIDGRLATNDTSKIKGIRSPMELLMSDVFDDLLVGSPPTVKPKPLPVKVNKPDKTTKSSKSSKKKTKSSKKSNKSSSKSKKRLRGGSFSTVKTHYDSEIKLEDVQDRTDLFV